METESSGVRTKYVCDSNEQEIYIIFLCSAGTFTLRRYPLVTGARAFFSFFPGSTCNNTVGFYCLHLSHLSLIIFQRNYCGGRKYETQHSNVIAIFISTATALGRARACVCAACVHSRNVCVCVCALFGILRLRLIYSSASLFIACAPFHNKHRRCTRASKRVRNISKLFAKATKPATLDYMHISVAYAVRRWKKPFSAVICSSLLASSGAAVCALFARPNAICLTFYV